MMNDDNHKDVFIIMITIITIILFHKMTIQVSIKVIIIH